MTIRIAARGLALSTLASAAQGADMPDLVGVWKGALTSGALYFPPKYEQPTYYNAMDSQIIITMTINGQDGPSFQGEMGNHDQKEIVVGVVRADGKTLLMTDNDGYKTATMLTSTSMEYCVQVASDPHRVSACGVLEKE